MRCPPVCARRVFFSLLPPPPRYPLFPYTTLFRSPKILVVDDDPAISEMLTIVLESEGLQPIPITDGNDAVPAFEQHNPDLILLDLMLPGMNGVDICRAIRRDSNVPIVMLTAKTDTVDVVLGLESGADDYVTKPFKR